MVSLADIQAARERLAGHVRETPCTGSKSLSHLCGDGEILFKLETLQKTGSFKARGALNKVLSLTDEQRAAGVVAASAGNHAQGVAFATATAGARALIVMPETTPQLKVARTAAWGCEVALHGPGFDAAFAHSMELGTERGLTPVHPFEDDVVIAGQGTLALELLEQIPDVEAVVGGVGGGGLMSGVATAIKESRPDVLVYGVQSSAAPSMKRSFEAGTLTEAPVEPTIAEGMTVRRPGERTFAILQRYLDGLELVSELEIEAAIFRLLETGKMLAEGAGAAPFAALMQKRFPALAGKRTAVILSGANIDLRILGRIFERALVKQQRMVRLRAQLTDRPGSLAALLDDVAALGANVLRIHHNRAFTGSPFWEAEVELTVETRDESHSDGLVRALRERGHHGVDQLPVPDPPPA